MKILVLLALTLSGTASFAQSPGLVKIPDIMLQCLDNEAPCSEGAGQYSSMKDPFYILGVIITTARSCDVSSLNSSVGTTVAFSAGALSEAAQNYQDGTYGVYLNKYMDEKGSLISAVVDQPYTVCVFYGSVTTESLTMTYYKSVSTSFKNLDLIAVTPDNWLAL